MKKLQIISLIALIITVFITIDLGINLIFSLIPQLQDGISSHSVLQSTFGIFRDGSWSQEHFFFAFEKSLWITFVMFVENVVVLMLTIVRKQTK